MNFCACGGGDDDFRDDLTPSRGILKGIVVGIVLWLIAFILWRVL